VLGLSKTRETILRFHVNPTTKQPTLVSPFARFLQRHGAANRWFRSTDVAYMATKMLAKQQEPAALAQTLLPKKLRWKHTFRNYPGRFPDQEHPSRASIRDLLQDLKEGWQAVLRATIVREVGALEIFLREWAIEALSAATAPGTPLRSTIRRELEDSLHELLSDPFRTVSLSRIGGFFPGVRGVLNVSTHVRSQHPMLTAGSSDLTCQTVTEMWRDVRNLILHHDGVVHPRFATQHSAVWLALAKDAHERGRTLAMRRCSTGQPLPLVTRHAVFCFTSCHQTAALLDQAMGRRTATGGHPTAPATEA